MHNILCDVHTHTLYSAHAYSTLEENVRAAASRGIHLLGSTDHFSCMVVPGVDFAGTSDQRGYQFFLNQRYWPRLWHGVIVLRGAETDIVDLDGHLFGHGYAVQYNLAHHPFDAALDLDERVGLGLDYFIASIHRRDFTLDATRAQNTRMYIKALENPKVLALGHIARSMVDFELDPVLEAARDLHKLIEINEHSFDGYPGVEERLRHLVRRCAEIGCSVSCGSDAHIAPTIGVFDRTCALFDEFDFPVELVACRDEHAFLDALAASEVPGPAGEPAYALGGA